METVTNIPGRRARRVAFIVCLIALTSTVGAFLLPIPLSFQIPLALGLIVAEMHTGACIIYFGSLKKFTLRLKVAYSIICAGSIFIAVGTVQLLVVNALGWQQISWVVYGGTELPILIGLFLAFLGYARFAVLLGMKRAKWLPFIVAAVCLMMFGIVPFLPHIPRAYSELGLDISMSLSAMQSVMLLAGIILVVVMKRRIGTLYTAALAWTMLAFIFGVLATGQQFFEYLFLPDDHWYVTYRLYTICIGISGIFSLKAALVFSTIPSASELPILQGKQSFFGRPKQTPVQKQRALSLIDLVMFTGSLASDQRALAQPLHRIQVLTDTIGTLQNTPIAAKRILAGTYCEIEDYLVEREAVRSYSRQELRKLVAERFADQLEQEDFWELVEQNRTLTNQY
jgi:hypothetical protein